MPCWHGCEGDWLETMNLRKGEVFQAAAFLALIIVLAFGDVVFLGRTLLTSNIPSGTMPSGAYGYNGRRVSFFPVLDAGASAWDYEPDVEILHDDIARGWLPLWNPHVGNGAPFLANMFSAALSPTRLLLSSLRSPAFWDVYLLSRLFAAAFLMFLFARSIEVGFTGSMIAAIAFALCGHFILEVNMPDLDAQIWLPALLLMMDRLLRQLSYRTFLLTALLIALIILAGMPESALFVFLLAGLYFLARAWALQRSNPIDWPALGRQTISLAGAAVVGLLISMPAVLPFLEYLQHGFNPRAPGVGNVHADINTAVSIIMPRFFGHLHNSWSGIDSFSMLPYVGAAAFLLALVALCRNRSLSRLAMFFASFAIFYFLKAFGIPPVQWISHLPLFSMSVFPKHAFPELAFCLAILAGMGAEAVLRNEVSYFRFAIASILMALIVAGFAAFYWTMAVRAGALRGITRSCLIVIVNLGLLWILAWAARRFGPRRLVALGLVLLPAAELVAFIPRERTDRYNAFTVPPFVEFLHSDHQKYRTFSMENFLYPDTSAAYGIDDIRSLDPIQVSRYVDFLRKDVSPKIYDRFDGSEPNGDFLQSPLLDLMNVKYVIGSSDIRSRDFISDLLRDAFVLPTSRWGIGNANFVIDRVPKGVLFQHPPSRIDYETTLREPTHLKFALALDPKAWEPQKGDGVVFQVDATSLSSAQKVFSQYIDPKNRASDRKLHEHSIDLSRYRGQDVYLIFQTLAGMTGNYDSAHWAQLPGGIKESLRAKLPESQVIAPAPNYVGPTVLTIGGRKLETWGQQPPATVRFRLRIPDDQPALNFAIALDPAVWKPEDGDGVTFEILVAPVQTLFSRSIDPKNNVHDRRWYPADLDLSSFGGQQVLLSFHTLPQANNAYDWAGWGDLRLETEKKQERFDLVYDNEVKIYRNNQVLPRAFLAQNAEVIPDKNRIWTRLTEADFDARRTVLLEENPANQLASPTEQANASSVVFDNYEPNYVRMRTSSAQPGWLVLLDTYYPGWQVRIDGKEGRILAADYIFRGVSLPSGSHEVEFVYRPVSFLLGVAISASTIVTLLFVPLVLGFAGRPLHKQYAREKGK